MGRGLGVRFPWEPRPASQSLPSPAQLLPESKFPHVPDQPAYGIPQDLCSLMSLSPGVWVGPAGRCQGELSDSGATGRLRGLSETWRGKRRKSEWREDSSLARPPEAFPGPIACCWPLEEARCEVGVGVHEKNLGNSYLTPEPKSSTLCSFTPFFIRSTNMLYFGQKTNLTPVHQRAHSTGGL